MSFHAQLLRELELDNDISGYDYRKYQASSHPSSTHYRNETPWWKATLHFSAPVLLIFAGIIYTLFHAYDLTWLSLTDLFWNYIVHFTPYKLVVIFDKEAQAASLGASKFSTSVSHAEKSAMMRRIVGLDKPGGIMSTVAQAGRRRLSIIPGLSMRGGGIDDEIRPAGLGNWDNSCYQNSVLQGLSALNDFDKYLRGPRPEHITSSNCACDRCGKGPLDERPMAPMQMANSLYTLIQKLKDPTNNGIRLWTPSALKNMSSWQQQDAQEYFSKVVDEIDREMDRANRHANPISHGLPAINGHPKRRQWKGFSPTLQNPLEGLLAQRVACTFCGFTEGLSLIPFTTLTLSLPSQTISKFGFAYQLSDLLDSYTQLEFIDGVDCGRCTLRAMRAQILDWIRTHSEVTPREGQFALKHLRAVVDAIDDEDFSESRLKKDCQVAEDQMVDSTKSKQAVIARPPKSLVVHVNRSMFDENTGELSKNHAPVAFQETLDLGPWCLGSASRPSCEDKGVSGPDEESWSANPKRSMISRGTPDMSESGVLKSAVEIANGRGYVSLPAKKSMIQGPIYNLRALIVHQGRHENGHYVTYKRFPVPLSGRDTPLDEVDDAEDVKDEVTDLQPETTEEWFRLSDDDVTQVSASEVFDRYSQQGAFMLFYDQISPACRVDAVVNPPDKETSPIPATKHVDESEPIEYVSPDDLLVKKLLDPYPPEEMDVDWWKRVLNELDTLSVDGGSATSSPGTVETSSPESVASLPLKQPSGKSKREVDWKMIEHVARAMLPHRAQAIATMVQEDWDIAMPDFPPRDLADLQASPSDSDLTSTPSSPRMSAAEHLQPVVPIVVKPYMPKAGKDAELSERGGGGRKKRNGKGRKVGGGMVMV